MKRWISAVAAVLILLLCACNSEAPEATAAATKEIDSTDGAFVVRVPESWSVYDAPTEEYLILALWDNNSAYAKIYFYSYDIDNFTVDDFLEENKHYYGSSIKGDVQDADVNGMKGYSFEYSMVDTGEDGSEYNYHGYEYLLDAGEGILETDIYYSQTKLESKLYEFSAEQLAALRDIAQSVVKKQAR